LPCEQCGLSLEGYYGPEARREAARMWPCDWRAEDVRLTSKVGYLCKVAFDEEMGRDINGTTIYPTLDSVPKHEGCGIVKVEINLLEVVKEEDFSREIT